MQTIVHEVHDPSEFMTRTAALRQVDPIATNQIASIAIAVLNGMRGATDVHFYTISSDESDRATSFAMWNSSRGVYLSPTVSEAEATALGELIGSDTNEQPLVLQCSGVRRVVEAFGAAYCHHRQPAARFHWHEDLVLYVLETLHTPTHVAGRMRMAASDDLALLKEWAVAFFAFIGAPVADAP
ncbi:hypothetical protein As57867_007964, partial [Aphanomyces stellatus]